MPSQTKLRQQARVGRVRAALAGHLRHCSASSSAYFFTINGDCRHPFSLANRCGALDNSQWCSLLVAANLAHIRSNTKTLDIKKKEWDQFITTHELQDVERIERTQFDPWLVFDGTRTRAKKFPVLRVGPKIPGSPNSLYDQIEQGRKRMAPPPKFPGLSAWQRTLRRVTADDSLDVVAEGLVPTDSDGVFNPPSSNLRTKRDRAESFTPEHGTGDLRTPKRRKNAHDTSTPCPATQHEDPSTAMATPSPVLGKHAAEFPIACELFGPAFDPSDPISRGKIHGLILEALRMEGDGNQITVVQPSNLAAI